ncbi:hypothetical protein MMC20_004207 [Loxospora ochrophaea]|nr:hypothetical protein [Loxospora ochrophaea]
MPEVDGAKSQPWKVNWPVDPAKSVQQPGTQHGFVKGEAVVLDGNTGGFLSSTLAPMSREGENSVAEA